MNAVEYQFIRRAIDLFKGRTSVLVVSDRGDELIQEFIDYLDQMGLEIRMKESEDGNAKS